jgi:formylmethanofuran dehydrogenase subunit C
MSALTLTLADTSAGALDLGGLTPAALRGLKPTAMRRLRVPAGNRQVPLADLFEISGDDPSTLRLHGLTVACHRIGRGLREGRIEVKGRVGDELGREMRGGEIRVNGHAGSGAGMGMMGGYLYIDGSVGDALGGITPGATRGMNGGVLVVAGNAGARCGERMRRGLMVVGGDVGDYLGDRMLAGSIVVFGRTGAHAGFGMRRGTLLLAHAPQVADAGYSDCGEFELGIVTLMRQYLASFHPTYAKRLGAFNRARRWSGDMAYGGKGEILVAASGA